MMNDNSETSPFDRFMQVAATSQFQEWLEGWRTKVVASNEMLHHQSYDRSIMNYPDKMRQAIIEDLPRLGITDPAIVRAAEAGDLDTVANLLKRSDPNDQEKFMIRQIEGWRQSLTKPPSEEH